MKKLLILIFLYSKAFANTYYVNNTTGNDANTSVQAQNSATPWKTIAKLNTFTFSGSDIILFNRGDVFYGVIIPNTAGLTYDAYGTGAKPIITGLSTVTGWVNIGGSLYEAPVANVKTGVNLVLRNNVIQQVGRFPNVGSTNGGYLVVTSGSTTSLTGPALASTTDWTGAEVVVRTVRWNTERKIVTSHLTGTLVFGTMDYSCKAGFGYFFQRDSRTLDVDGEWWYNSAASKLRVYSNINPTGWTYQIATIDTLFKNVYGNTSVSNLSFIGSGAHAIYSLGGSILNITNCNFDKISQLGIFSKSQSNVTITGCVTNDCLSGGIRVSNPTNGLSVYYRVENNTVTNSSLITGMEASDQVNGGSSILVNGGDSVIVRNNTINNSGYCGIEWKGSQAHINNNYVNQYCLVRSDGGGIYTVENGNNALIYPRNTRYVTGNIINGGIGNYLGSPDTYNIGANGIYVDLGTRNVIIDTNTISNNSSGAFHGNNNDSLWFRQNVFYNNNTSYSFQRFAGALPMRSIFMNNNVIDKYRFEYTNLAIDSPSVVTKESDILAMGAFANNYYSLRGGTDTSLLSVTDWYYGGHYTTAVNNFAYLTGTIGVETSSTNFANTGVLYTNPTASPITVSFPGLSNKDHAGIVFNNSVVIAPYRSKILLPNGSTVPVPSNIIYGTYR